MEKYTRKVEEVTGEYNRKDVEEKARERAMSLLSERLGDLSEASAAEKITALETLIAEYAATEEGTNIPMNNNNRHDVEALSRLLSIELENYKIQKLTNQYLAFA